MLEKMAYWNMLLQMPIYLAQKDAPGGLHWEQTIKGVIFFWWALVQNFSPIFFGFLSDKYSDKRVLNASLFVIFFSYLFVGLSTELMPMIASVVLLGLGSAMYKPTIQGAIARELTPDNESRGWGIYFMLINLAVFIAPPISKYFKEISWFNVFLGSMAITAINLVVNFIFNKKIKIEHQDNLSPRMNIKWTFENLFKADILLFIISMSGFAIIYMQFYETLPNFIYDWTNTTSIAKHLPDFMLMTTSLGKMISYEWLYNINSILVLVLVVWVSTISSKINILKAIIIGIILSICGLVMSGFSTYGWLTIIGIIVYTLGEMITNPKFTQYLSQKAGQENKSMYLSYLNISFGIGLTFGAIFGSWIYESFAEKSELASRYLFEYYNIGRSNAKGSFAQLLELSKMNEIDLVNTLFNHYHPNHMWLPFIFIGLIAIIGLFLLIKIDKRNRA